MDNDTIFLYIIAAAALCFALINCIQFIMKRNKTAQTTGTIISIKMPNPETAKARNSKWAELTYTVAGKTYRSKNRIQVSMASRVGDSVTVRYDMEHPEKLYSFSASRIIASLLVAAICVLAAFFKLV